MFVFVTIPDLELRAAAKTAGEAWTGEVAMALDPDGHRQASGRRRTGQVNAAARYRGVRSGMVLGQAVDLNEGGHAGGDGSPDVLRLAALARGASRSRYSG